MPALGGFVGAPLLSGRRRPLPRRSTALSRRAPWVASAGQGLGYGATLRLYNTMTRTKELFEPLEPGLVKFYSCGPTVYDFAHIGNFRAFLTYDIIKRWLLYQGYDVKHVLNLTDVEDKIIRKVKDQDTDLKTLTEHFTREFFTDMKTLNIIPADVYPRATAHIPEVIDMVKGLKDRGVAYEKDGSMYFSVEGFPSYGRLAQLEKRKGSLGKSEREGVEDSDEYDKNDARDFVLWKKYKEEDGEVFWDTELGRGRPGWHIECSCMALKYLGERIDIHSGGIDLVFPHHENEIAQSEAFCCQSPYANYWMHNGFVNIDGEKMSKSKGNFWTLRDIVETPDDARAFRYFIVSSQYRTTLNMSEEALGAAKSSLERIDRLQAKLDHVAYSPVDSDFAADAALEATLLGFKEDFVSHMNDDLNTPRAVATVFQVVNTAEKLLKRNIMSGSMAILVKDALNDFDRVLGIFYKPDLEVEEEEDLTSSPELEELLIQRTDARSSKDWALADEIRDRILAAGFVVKDTPGGPQLIPR